MDVPAVLMRNVDPDSVMRADLIKAWLPFVYLGRGGQRRGGVGEMLCRSCIVAERDDGKAFAGVDG